MSNKVKTPKASDTAASPKVKDIAKLDDVIVQSVAAQSAALTKKINGLKNLQLEMVDVEAKFYDELHELECKYSKLYEPFYERRKKIITGEYEPTGKETEWALDELNETEDESENAEKDKKPIEGVDESKLSESGKQLLKDLKEQFDPKKANGTSDEKGIPNFWLETLQSFRITAEIIQEYDEPILAFLQDITCHLFDQKPYGYKLEFHFAENPYFTNKVLTKTYELTNEIDPKDPFSFEGPDLQRSLGCKIDWKAGKNVTIKLIKKKLKPKNKKGVPKIITKEEKQDSFFNFFETIEKKTTNKSPASSGAEDKAVVAVKGRAHSDDDDDDEEDDSELYRIADFEIGQYLREKIIPKAILYYTGEIDGLEDDYDDYDEEDEDEDLEGGDEDEDDDDEDEDDDDDDEDDDGKKPGKGKKPLAVQGKGAKSKPSPGAKGGEPTPSECKQN